MDDSRRNFLKKSSAISILPVFAAAPKPLLGKDGEPHFFIHLILAGGMDPLYAFDSRPLEFTDKNLFTNYTYKNVSGETTLSNPVDTKFNGERPGTLRSPLTEPLMKYRDQFTVFNGLHFKSDVHELNVPNMFFGNNAGGDNFVASIGANLPGVLDCINIGRVGTLPSFGNNFTNSVAMPVGKNLFGKSLESAVVPESNLASVQQIMANYNRYASGYKSFSGGVQATARGFQKIPNLMEKFKELAEKMNKKSSSASSSGSNPASPAVDTKHFQMVDNALMFLQTGITSAINLIFDFDQGQSLSLDCHSFSSARKQTQTFQKLFSEVAHLFKQLNETYFDQAKNIKMMDVTTVLITTEMGRSRKSLGNANAPITETGSDHNAYSGTSMMAGKGINGGLTIGESDLRKIDENNKFTDASKVHVNLDNQLLRPMGLPFDHNSSKTVFTENPEEYRPLDYLSIENVMNTAMSMFDIKEQDRQRIAGRTAPVIKRVLKK